MKTINTRNRIPEIDAYLDYFGVQDKDSEPAREIATRRGRTLRKPDREKRREAREAARVKHVTIIQLRKARQTDNFPAQEQIEKLLRMIG